MTDRTIGTIGKTDRAARVVIGLVLLGFALACPWAAAQGAAVQWISGIVGAVLVATAAIRFCPLYKMLGICTA